MPLTEHHRKYDKAAGWVRMVIGVSLAVALAVFIGLYLQRDSLVAGCIRTGERAVLIAEFMEDAAKARRADGKLALADKYKAKAAKMRATVPMPEGWEGDAHERGNSLQDRMSGCEEAYPPPLRYVR